MRLHLVHRVVMVALIVYILADLLITYYVEGLSEPHVVTGVRTLAMSGDSQKAMVFSAAIVAAAVLTWLVSKRYFE